MLSFHWHADVLYLCHWINFKKGTATASHKVRKQDQTIRCAIAMSQPLLFAGVVHPFVDEVVPTPGASPLSKTTTSTDSSTLRLNRMSPFSRKQLPIASGPLAIGGPPAKAQPTPPFDQDALNAQMLAALAEAERPMQEKDVNAPL